MISSQNPLETKPIGRLVIHKSSGMMLGILGIMLFFLAHSWFIALLGTEALAAR